MESPCVAKKKPEQEEPRFDELLEQLRSVVSKLETGDLSLEESLKAYEDGVTMAKRGHSLLDSAEKKVEVLVKSGETRALDQDEA